MECERVIQYIVLVIAVFACANWGVVSLRTTDPSNIKDILEYCSFGQRTKHFVYFLAGVASIMIVAQIASILNERHKASSFNTSSSNPMFNPL